MKKIGWRAAFKNTWFRKFARSMICLALIPMLVIMFFYYRVLNSRIEEEYLELFSSKVEDVQDKQNAIWDEISNITVTLNNHPRVLSYIQSEHDPLLAGEVRAVLYSLTSAHSSIDEIFLFRPDGKDVVVSGRYVFSPDAPVTAPKLNGDSVLKAFSALDNNGIGNAFYLDLNYGQHPKPYPVLLYRVNGFYDTVNPHGFNIVYSVRTEVLLEHEDLRSTDDNELGGIALLGRDGRVLGISGQNQEKLSAALEGLHLPVAAGEREVRTDGGTYKLLYDRDQFNQFRSVLLLSAADGAVPINQELMQLLVLFIIVTAAVLLLCIYLLVRNYSPVRNLEDDCANIMENMKENSDQGGNTPFESIDATLQSMKAQIQNLKGVINNNQDRMRNELLLSLFNGQPQPRLEEALQANEMIFAQKGFSVIYVTFEDSHISVIECRNGMVRFLKRRQYNCFAASGLGNWFALLVNHDMTDRGNLTAAVNDYQNLITERDSGSIMTGIASAECSLRDLPMLYAKAKMANEYHFMLGSSLIVYDEIDRYLEPALPGPLYAKLKEELAQGIRDGNLEQVRMRLKILHDNLSHSSRSLMETRHLCYDLIFFVENQLNERTGEPKHSMKFEELSQVRNVDVLFERLFAQCEQELKRQEKSEKQVPSVDEINAYIEEHYTDQLFSISDLAERYQMSASAFSQYYKKKTGITISDFLMHSRIERAMKLLVSTDHPVNQIVSEIGYYSVSSFIKKFKTYTGMTPGEYRLTNKA